MFCYNIIQYTVVKKNKQIGSVYIQTYSFL